MFRNWGFLLGEIWVLLLLAALLGLLAGWLIWSRREVTVEGDTSHKDQRIAELEQELSTRSARLIEVEKDLGACRSQSAQLESDLAACRSDLAAAPAAVAAVAPAVAPEPEPEADADADADAGAIDEPLRLDAPRGGVADDLKRIRGIGPQMEKLCHSLGFYHFDQVASWTETEVAWVDQNLTGFQGRVTRDQWVEQAQVLAKGEETDFSKRVDKGDVPSSQ